MKYARDVMTAKPLCLKESDSLDEALEAFLRHQYRSLPVVDEKHRSLGMMTEMALIKAFAFLKGDASKNLVKHHTALLEKPLVVNADTLVKDFMSNVSSAGHTRVIVETPQDKKVIGIISPRDILKLFGGKILDKILEEKQDEIDLVGANKQYIDDFYKNLKPEDTFHKIFEKNPKMQILFNNKGIMVGLNKSFREYFNFENTDISELKLEHLFSETSFMELMKEMATAKLESKKEGLSLNVLKNAKNFIPVKADLICIQEKHHYLFLLEMRIDLS